MFQIDLYKLAKEEQIDLCEFLTFNLEQLRLVKKKKKSTESPNNFKNILLTNFIHSNQNLMSNEIMIYLKLTQNVFQFLQRIITCSPANISF